MLKPEGDPQDIPRREAHSMDMLDEAKAKAEGLAAEAKEKAQGLAGATGGKVDSVMGKVEEFIDDKTGNKFADKVDKVTDEIREHLGGHAD
jgi:hypothetical protein